MRNKPFKHVTHLLYCFLLSLPVISILGRVIYTQSNPNAMDSYSNNVVTKYSHVNNSNVYIENNVFEIVYNENVTFNQSLSFTVSDTSAYNLFDNPNNLTITSLAFIYESAYARVNIGLSNGSTVRVNSWNEITTKIWFVLKYTNVTSNAGLVPSGDIYMITYETLKLDNAFDYSVSKFIQNNNFGNVDLFSWFGDIFLDTQNETNKLYLDFINWYLNYTLLVSSSYLIFMVLYWFTAYVRKIMDKSMNQDFGGF